MLIKTLLNRIGHFKSFVFGAVTFQDINGSEALVVEIKAWADSKPECPGCGKRSKNVILSQFGISSMCRYGEQKVFFQAPRRVACPDHGVKVECGPMAKNR